MPCFHYSAQIANQAIKVDRRNYVRKQAVSGTANGAEAVLSHLEVEHPEVAKKLRSLNWESIVQFTAKAALERATKRIGAKVGAEFELKQHPGYEQTGALPSGELLGVLKYRNGADEVQVGLMANGTELSFIVEQYDQERNATVVAKLQKELETAYREESVKNVLRLLGGEVEEERGAAQTVVFSTKIRGGLK
ncbi:MAG: hypothetical protein ACOYUZ_00905 [Patescibacteria group bacterium]